MRSQVWPSMPLPVACRSPEQVHGAQLPSLTCLSGLPPQLLLFHWLICSALSADLTASSYQQQTPPCLPLLPRTSRTRAFFTQLLLETFPEHRLPIPSLPYTLPSAPLLSAKGLSTGRSPAAQSVKDLALLPLWFRSPNATQVRSLAQEIAYAMGAA